MSETLIFYYSINDKNVVFCLWSNKVPDINISYDYILAALKKLVSINSVLPNEEPLAAFIADEIRSYGLEPVWHEVAPGRPNVYASLGAGPTDKFLVFSGHSDTVPPASDWEHDPFRPLESNGRLYGLGAINMKAGLACILIN
ncbi:MAG: hypothetical protein CVT49_15490 [candidate division Zixibacteria bacterium HGW-Zixibacteria-1]|nr:MAG: hypothetical protein CVT49_15490 [candidate division Zixibacteria bacterium HGW-Zixibacteria-1]